MTAPQPLSPEAHAAARTAAYEDARHDYEQALAQAAREEAHERHGGSEAPEPDECVICADDDETLYGGGA